MIAYKEYGKGDTVVLIHGYCEDKSLWHFHANHLAEHYRVICVDLPGFGESDLLENTSMESFAASVYELLCYLQVSLCTMVGHSLGGYVTLAFAEKYPELLTGFGLFHSTAFADSKEKQESRNKTIDFIERKGVELFATAFVPPLFHLSNRSGLEETIKEVTTVARHTSKEAIIATAKAMRDRRDRTDILETSKVPVLFIAGNDDQAVPIEATKSQCNLASNTFVQFLNNTGHMGMYERPQATLQSLKAFISLCN